MAGIGDVAVRRGRRRPTAGPHALAAARHRDGRRRDGHGRVVAGPGVPGVVVVIGVVPGRGPELEIHMRNRREGHGSRGDADGLRRHVGQRSAGDGHGAPVQGVLHGQRDRLRAAASAVGRRIGDRRPVRAGVGRRCFGRRALARRRAVVAAGAAVGRLGVVAGSRVGRRRVVVVAPAVAATAACGGREEERERQRGHRAAPRCPSGQISRDSLCKVLQGNEVARTRKAETVQSNGGIDCRSCQGGLCPMRSSPKCPTTSVSRRVPCASRLSP